MKKLMLVAAVLIANLFFPQVKWMTIPEAIEAQKTAPKKILIDFYADWCASCKTMDRTTFAHPVISDFINENYYPVKFNAESRETFSIFGREFSKRENGKNALHEFTKFMNVSSVPSLVFIDEQTMPITILNGMLTAKELEPYLSLIAENEYQKIGTRQQWDAYQKKFRSKIKD